MNLALAQMTVIGGDTARNLSTACHYIAEASGQGADLVLLPEALDLGWTHPSARDCAGEIPDGEAFTALARVARREKIWVCAGLVERDGDRIFNSAVLMDAGGDLRLKHRKIHELDIARDLYTTGDPESLSVCDTPFGRVGVSICADGFAPGQWIHRRLAELGAKIILSPSAWAVPGEHDNAAEPYGELWRDNYRPVCQEHKLWIFGCSNVGPIDAGPWAGRKCIGNSLAIGPGGREILTGPHGESAEALLMISVPLPGGADLNEIVQR